MKNQKQVTIIARYTNKKTGVVSYLVRSSDGKTEYCTTLIDGKASGCSCPSRNGKCYHRSQLELKESGRPFAAKKMPVWALWLIESGVLVAPKQVVETVAPTVVSPVVEQEQSWAELIELEDKMSIASKRDTSVLNGAQQSAGLLMQLPSRKAKAS